MINTRNFFPKTLFGRTLIIVGIPILVLQFVILYIFFERHWEDVGRRLVLALGGQIADLTEDIKYLYNDPTGLQNIFEKAERNHLMKVIWLPNKNISDIKQHKLSSVLDFTLKKSLSERIQTSYKFDTVSVPKSVSIYVSHNTGVLKIIVARKTLYSSTTFVFIGWMLGTSILLLLIAIYFLRGQIAPLRKVAKASEAFGKGDNYHELQPRGATEVRMVAQSFLEMRERIINHIKQRTEMLAGIGHDLKTPLTRMNLQIALLDDKQASQNLNRDVEEMNEMLDAYLAFAKGEEEELLILTDLGELLKAIVKLSKINTKSKIKLDIITPIKTKVKPLSLKRAIVNLVDNASNFAKKHIHISLEKQESNAFISIEDDGPGIPDKNKEEVFKAFYRLDPSRLSNSGNTGLGLTITRDIVRGHGGEIHLYNSKLGGLKARLRIPI